MSKELTKDSKFLSLILRHKPDLVGIEIQEEGWVKVESLLEKCAEFGRPISKETLRIIVESDEKQRYSFKDDGEYIRANQGHSIDVDMSFKEESPPIILYHGTARKNIESIKRQGLTKQNRQYVHLSKDFHTARTVGSRHGTSVVYNVKAYEMSKQGYKFFLSENGIWLTEWVPTNYLSFNNDL